MGSILYRVDPILVMNVICLIEYLVFYIIFAVIMAVVCDGDVDLYHPIVVE